VSEVEVSSTLLTTHWLILSRFWTLLL